MQKIIIVNGKYEELNQFFIDDKVKKLLLVCDSAIQWLTINAYFDCLEQQQGIQVLRFSDFQSNPTYESVVKGVEKFRTENCDAIFAVGGGSAMDVAKCIKLYANMEGDGTGQDLYLGQQMIPNRIPLYAMPTTAGTGSEATKYAVIYYNGMKQSVTDESCIPSVVLLDASTLKTLPAYQKKSTMLDALCHGVESYWSVNATEESKEYSREALRLVLENVDAYLANKASGNEGMLKAAHFAGKAINIAQTTAGHAMCYKLTSLYGIAHGHAVALCVRKLWPYMIENMDKCIDKRGRKYLEKIFSELAGAFGCGTPGEAVEKFSMLFNYLELAIPACTDEEVDILTRSVNPVRLKNNPVALTEEAIRLLYNQILGKDMRNG